MDFPGLSLLGYNSSDLHDPRVLEKLTLSFYEYVKGTDPSLYDRFRKYQTAKTDGLPPIEVSELLESMAGYLSRFMGSLFGVEKELEQLRHDAENDNTIFECKREFVVRRVLKKFSPEQMLTFDLMALSTLVSSILGAFPGIDHNDPELETASAILFLMRHERFVKVGLPPESVAAILSLAHALKNGGVDLEFFPHTEDERSVRLFLEALMSVFEQWLAACYVSKESGIHSWAMLQVPSPVDYHHLVVSDTDQSSDRSILIGPQDHHRRRDGFDLTDDRFDARRASGEVDYCIICHKREKDTCSHGFHEGEAFKKNPLGFELKGCPLDQRISESHELRAKGDSLGALAVIMIDNPMVPGTGHRICNDCMKACIYQKQDPVNIPQAETRILSDVLSLPWGFEIYSLLTRWNPLNIQRPHALAYNGKKILVVGLGPAGYTLAHYLCNEGFGVVGIDGLKIEPLPAAFFLPDGGPAPIRDFAQIQKRLSERPLAGFGGVSEYGITVRWDKNFLTVLHLNLLRRNHFSLFDGVRFGGTITVEDAWRYGFDHICIATGAGKPTFVRMKNNMIRGIRKASDFLMALQLTGAGKRDSMANLQVRLPAIVIGGGLTAIDTATEVMAYYPVQVTKMRQRFDALCERYGKDAVLSAFDDEERETLTEFLAHADAIAAERRRASIVGESPDFLPLLNEWGGVHIYYRKSLEDSPAYRLNHEEIIKGLEEGFGFVEGMSPAEAIQDQYGALKEIVFDEMQSVSGAWKKSGRIRKAPARTALIAAGTVPNVMYEREHPGTFTLDANDEFFLPHRFENGKLQQHPGNPSAFFTSYLSPDNRTVTFYGDNHPAYAGNVVKAMASAKNGFRHVVSAVEARETSPRETARSELGSEWQDFVRLLRADLAPRVVKVNRLAPAITEIVVRAPKATREFHPGQFYRLQNYEADSPREEGTLLMMEGVALTGAWVDKTRGEIGMIALEVGASSRMCSMLKPDQRIVVMGPTGTPTEIGEKETVILLGGGLGNAVLFSIGRAFKEKGGKVIYFAGYKKREDFFKREWVEAAADVVVYSVDSGNLIPVSRPNDRSTSGNIIQAALAYAKGELGSVPIRLDEASRVIAIGSDRMMAAVKVARHNELKPFLHVDHIGIASINSPMQCMMKAVCAQCLQRHVNPLTGDEEFVFTCVNQDQPIDEVDFSHLQARLRQNSVVEKITNRWLEHLWSAKGRTNERT